MEESKEDRSLMPVCFDLPSLEAGSLVLSGWCSVELWTSCFVTCVCQVSPISRNLSGLPGWGSVDLWTF